MKTEINDAINLTYPYLGKAKDGSVVLFTGPDEGFRLTGDMKFLTPWCESNFTRLPNGTKITLTQE